MTIATNTPVAEGERRRDDGIAVASAGEARAWLILRGQLALLDAIRAAPDRSATTDNATSDLWRTYPDGGHWRGGIPKALAAKKLIRSAGAVLSNRAARHRGYVTVWQGIDDGLIDAHRDELRRLLATMPTPPPEPRTLFDDADGDG